MKTPHSRLAFETLKAGGIATLERKRSDQREFPMRNHGWQWKALEPKEMRYRAQFRRLLRRALSRMRH